MQLCQHELYCHCCADQLECQEAVLPPKTILRLRLQEEMDQLSHQREQLVLAEKLFDMDITGYPDLAQVGAKVGS